MKKRILLLFFAGLFSLGLFAQDVPEVQKSLITKRTATWCSFCGGWGWDFFSNLVQDNSANALVIAAHHSGDLTNSAATAITSNFGGISQPRFYLGNEDQSASSGNAATKRTEIQSQVITNSGMAPVVNAGVTAVKDGNDVTLSIKTRFFQATEGEYYVAAYVIEDGVINFQASQSSSAVHKNVLRAAFTNDTFGELVAEGSIAAGDTFDKTFSMTLDPSWVQSNLEIAVIVWKKDGDEYLFVNTNSTDTFEPPTAVNDFLLSEASLQLAPNVSTDLVDVWINSKENLAEANLYLSNVIGQRVATIFQGELLQGEQRFELRKANAGPAGLYFLTLESGGKVLTKKVIFR